MRFLWPFLRPGYQPGTAPGAGRVPPRARSVVRRGDEASEALERAAAGGAAGYSPEALARHNLGQVTGHLRRQGVPVAVIRAALRELAEGLE